jgi:hypothetical protein
MNSQGWQASLGGEHRSGILLFAEELPRLAGLPRRRTPLGDLAFAEELPRLAGLPRRTPRFMNPLKTPVSTGTGSAGQDRTLPPGHYRSETESRNQFRILGLYIMKSLKNAFFWDMTPCGCCQNRRFGGMYHLHYQVEKNQRARNSVSSN